jgi:membrane carboxypeptidase/penicillin-binding protein
MKGTTGITGAAPIWHDFMEEALKPLPVDQLPAPPGVEKMALTVDGKQWAEGCEGQKVEDLVATGGSTQAIEKCATPTPPPTATAAPATPAPVATAVPAAPSVPPTQAPSLDELRQRAGATATVEAAAFATRFAEQTQKNQPAPKQATQAPAQSAAPTQPATQATGSRAQPTQPSAPTATAQTTGARAPAPTATTAPQQDRAKKR